MLSVSLTLKVSLFQAGGSLDAEWDFITHRGTIVSLADVGAHLTGQTDACNATFILSYWVRDRNRLTGRNGLSIEQAINEHCARPAAFVGMTDRGTLEVGKKVRIRLLANDCSRWLCRSYRWRLLSG